MIRRNYLPLENPLKYKLLYRLYKQNTLSINKLIVLNNILCCDDNECNIQVNVLGNSRMSLIVSHDNLLKYVLIKFNKVSSAAGPC